MTCADERSRVGAWAVDREWRIEGSLVRRVIRYAAGEKKGREGQGGRGRKGSEWANGHTI